MQFVFNGTIEKLKETIHTEAREQSKNIIVYHNEPNSLEIGFQRLGHSGGRFFVANITEENDSIVLKGETKNIFPNYKSKTHCFFSELMLYLFAYLILAVIPITLWLFLRDIVSIWIPLILPIIYLVTRPHLNKIEEKKEDKRFINFMSSFATYKD